MYPQQQFGQGFGGFGGFGGFNPYGGFGGFGGFNPYGGFGGFDQTVSPSLFGGPNPYNDLFSGFQTKLDDLFKNYQTQMSQNIATQQQPVASENSAKPQEIFKKKPATGKPMQMKGKDGKTYSSMPMPTGNAQSGMPGLDSLIAKYNLQPKLAANANGTIKAPRMQPNTQYGQLINPLQGQTQTTNNWVAR